MTDKGELRAAVASGVVGSSETFHALLSAIVQVARAIFGATASSILLLDEESDELVFEAVVGEGEESLLGTRFPAGKGIAGWVLATRTPLVIEDALAPKMERATSTTADSRARNDSSEPTTPAATAAARLGFSVIFHLRHSSRSGTGRSSAGTESTPDAWRG